MSKKEENQKSNKLKRTVLMLITLLAGLGASFYPMDVKVDVAGRVMVGVFTCLLVGVPLTFFYIFSRRR